MIKRLLLTLLVASLYCTNAFAISNERYVDCKNGSDGNNGTSEALAWATVQMAFDTAGNNTRINVEWDDSSFDCTLSATIDIDVTNGSQDSPIILQGYSSTIGDGVHAVIDGNSAALNIFNVAKNYIMFVNIDIKGSTADAITGTSAGDWMYFIDSKILDAGDEGIAPVNGMRPHYVIGSEITGTSSTGYNALSSTGGGLCAYNYFHNITGVAIKSYDSMIFFRNIIDTTSLSNVISDDSEWWVENTFYNAVSGDNYDASIGNQERQHLINNIFNTASDQNIQVTSGGNMFIYANNNINGNGGTGKSGVIHLDLGGEVTTSPDFVSAATSNFAIGSNVTAKGFPSTFLGSNTTSSITIGAVDAVAGGGGGSSAETTLKLNGVKLN